jgi:hypothetical protein
MRRKGLERLIFPFINYPVSLCKLLNFSELIEFLVKIVLRLFFFGVVCYGLRPCRCGGLLFVVLEFLWSLN